MRRFLIIFFRNSNMYIRGGGGKFSIGASGAFAVLVVGLLIFAAVKNQAILEAFK